MSSSASLSARGAPATPARTMRTRMQRRSSLVPFAGSAPKRLNASPVKPRVLFPYRGCSSSGGGSVVSGTPLRTGAGVTMHRNRGRASASLATPLKSPLKTLDDQKEQPWWDELSDEIEPDSDLVNRLVDALRQQRNTHTQELQQAKQLILAKEKSYRHEIQESERMNQLQLQENERRLQEALDVAEDEFSNQERILAATQKDNERLMIQIGLLESAIDDSAYALAEANGHDEWQGILEQAAIERKGKSDIHHPRVSFGTAAPGEPIHRSIQAQSSALHKALPTATDPGTSISRQHSGDTGLVVLDSSGTAAGPLLSTDQDADESEVSMLLQAHAEVPSHELSSLAPGSYSGYSGEDVAVRPPRTLSLPKSTPKPRRVSNISAVTAPLPFSSPQMDGTFDTAGDPEDIPEQEHEHNHADTSVVDSEVAVPAVTSTEPAAARETLESMRLALLGLQRELALDKYSRQEYLDQADEKIHALEELVSSIAAGHGISHPVLRV